LTDGNCLLIVSPFVLDFLVLERKQKKMRHRENEIDVCVCVVFFSLRLDFIDLIKMGFYLVTIMNNQLTFQYNDVVSSAFYCV